MSSIVPIPLVGILLPVGVLLVWISGKQISFVDKKGKPLAGSLSEKIHVAINGIELGMFIKSKDATHPVLLYLYGGLPEYFLLHF